jgi:hypothetical protein
MEANQGFQSLGAEMMTYSKAAFDDAIRTWGQLIGVRSLEQAMQIQSEYAKRVYEDHWRRSDCGGVSSPQVRLSSQSRAVGGKLAKANLRGAGLRKPRPPLT